MKKLDFFAYPNNNPNSDTGPRSAAVMHFAGDFKDSFVKELTQNSLDARATRDGKLKVKIKLLEVEKNKIPNFEKFEGYLNQMATYWNQKNNQYSNFFNSAINVINQPKIQILAFEDFLTKGLTGPDHGNTFKSCVLDENVSTQKHSDALGGHGIGKNSVFGFSSLQTVFYSTLNEQNEYKFQGVSKLGTFEIDGIKKSEKIYYGLVDEENNSVEEIDDLNLIPELFKRSEKGLSQFVIGAKIGDDWIDNVLKSFILNYWMLFDQEKLEIEVANEKVDSNNYLELAIKLFASDKTNENPLHYIAAYKEGEKYTKEVEHLGEVHLHIKEEEEGLPNRILFLRSGMKIKLDSLGGSIPQSISGVMYCNNEQGNRILGAMEPPTHDNFKADLIENKQFKDGKTFTNKDGKDILDSIKQFKKDILNSIKSKYAESVSELDFIDEIFNSNFEGGGSANSGNSESKNEAFHKMPKIIDYQCEFSTFKKTKLIDNSKDDQIDSPNNPTGEGDGPGYGTGIGGAGIRGGKGKKKSIGGGGSLDDKTDKSKSKSDITARMFHSSSIQSGNWYTLIISSLTDVENCNLLITQNGDSSGRTNMSSRLLEVTCDGENVTFESTTDSKGEIIGYKLRNLSIIEDEKKVIKLRFEEKFRSSFNLI